MGIAHPTLATAPNDRTITGLPLVIWLLDHLSGERAPLVPGLFELCLAREIGYESGPKRCVNTVRS